MKADYAAKASSYFEQSRPEMAQKIPPECRRVLDVGCGAGEFGALLKTSRRIEVWGIEPFEEAAAHAEKKLDKVFCGTFSSNSNLPPGFFDCVIFNDVLEHVLEPFSALEYARTLLTPHGIVVASIPNIRHFPTIWRLVMYGDWNYRECGTLDRTHLRFFTRSSIITLFQAAGYSVRTIEGINPYSAVPNVSRKAWGFYHIVNAMFLSRFHDMQFLQFSVLAAPATRTPDIS